VDHPHAKPGKGVAWATADDFFSSFHAPRLCPHMSARNYRTKESLGCPHALFLFTYKSPTISPQHAGERKDKGRVVELSVTKKVSLHKALIRHISKGVEIK
jgi:hypothetical protein